MRWLKPKHVVTGLVLAVAVFSGVVWKSRRDERRDFDAYRQQLLASGAKLTMAEAMPPPDTNAGPWRAELRRLGESSVSTLSKSGWSITGIVGDSTNGFRPVWREPQPMSEKGPVGTWDGLAADVMVASNDLAALVVHLRNPPRRSDIEYRLAGTNMVHFVSWRSSAQALRVGFIHSERSYQRDRCLEHLEGLSGTVQCFREDGPLINLLIRNEILILLNECVAASLIEPKWSDVDLVAISLLLEKAEVISSTRTALEVERAHLAEFIELALNGPEGNIDGYPSVGPRVHWKDQLGAWLINAIDPVKYGPIHAKRALTLASERMVPFRGLDGVPNWKSVGATWQQQDRELGEPSRRSTFGDYRIVLVHLSRAGQTLYSAESVRSLNLTAIAIEQHWRRHGKLPETLDQLVPAFLKSVPLDPMDGAPLRYRLNPGGGFRLYSVGTNLVDDGGTGSLNSEGMDLVFPWSAKK